MVVFFAVVGSAAGVQNKEPRPTVATHIFKKNYHYGDQIIIVLGYS